MSWYLSVLKKYAVFSGRSRRKEYWMFILFNSIAGIAAVLLDNVLFGVAPDAIGPLGGVYSLAVLIPSLAVSVRRLHDVGKSGWFLLIALIPAIGAIWLLVLMCIDGEPGENRFGANPKA